MKSNIPEKTVERFSKSAEMNRRQRRDIDGVMVDDKIMKVNDILPGAKNVPSASVPRLVDDVVLKLVNDIQNQTGIMHNCKYKGSMFKMKKDGEDDEK